MEKSPRLHKSLKKRDNSIQKSRGILYAAVLAASTLNHGCVLQQEAKTIRYESSKTAEVKTVRRPIYYCSSSIKDVKNETSRCISDVLIEKKDGLHCLKCTTEVEQVKY